MKAIQTEEKSNGVHAGEVVSGEKRTLEQWSWYTAMTIRLRLTTEDDLDFVLKTEQDYENSAFVFSWTREEHRAILLSIDADHYVVEKSTDRSIVGYLIVRGRTDANQSVELKRIVITEKNKGYGRAVMRLVKWLAFEKWGAHRLWLDVKEHNTRARHLYESEGFVVEGVLRESTKTKAGYESLVLMSMLRREYEQGEEVKPLQSGI